MNVSIKQAAAMLVGVIFSASVLAASFTETNHKISYIRDSGFGTDEKFAAIKLDTQDTMEASCLWDIIIFDATTAEGKQAYNELSGLLGSNGTLKSISFTRDDETMDCVLEKYEI